jgi:hypothetical protein
LRKISHEDLQRRERPPGALARPHGMEAHAAVVEVRERLSDLALLVRAECVVHQPGGRAPHESDAGHRDVRRHRERDERVEPLPACERDGADAGDDADRGADVVIRWRRSVSSAIDRCARPSRMGRAPTAALTADAAAEPARPAPPWSRR